MRATSFRYIPHRSSVSQHYNDFVVADATDVHFHTFIKLKFPIVLQSHIWILNIENIESYGCSRDNDDQNIKI